MVADLARSPGERAETYFRLLAESEFRRAPGSPQADCSTDTLSAGSRDAGQLPGLGRNDVSL
jgi:hypothetical protein